LTPDWDVIEAFDVPEDGAFRVLMNTALAQGFLTAEWPTRWCPILQITPESTDPFLNCPSHHKSFRSRLTKKLKKLNDVGEVTFTVDYDLNNHALDRFIALESSGWKGANGSAIGSDSRVRDFYLQAARAAAIDGSLRLYALNLDGTPVAMHFGLFSHGTYFAPKVAYDESFAKFSPGQLLVQHVIRDISVQRATCYDFLGARSEWKSVWASSERAHSNCYIFRNSVRGRLLHALISRVAPTIRRLKYAVYGDPQALKAWAD
jgi:CelD/BcsL family acetyltransferase involved in cellulose biosynthesis